MRGALLAGAILAVALAALLVWRAQSERGSAAPDVVAREEGAVENGSLRARSEVSDGALGESFGASESAGDAVRAAVELVRPALSGPWHVEGTLVGLEVDGSRVEGGDGQLGVAFESGLGTKSGTFPVRDGGWRFLVPPGTVRIAIEGAVLGGRRGVLEVPWAELPERGSSHELRLVLEGSWLLHVVDAASGVDLDRVDVRVADGFEGAYIPADPSSLRALVSDAPSPVRVPTQAASGGLHFAVRCYVGGHGYAWQPVDLDGAERGERTVRLERAGALEVTVEGGDNELALQVGVFRPLPEKPHVNARMFGASARLRSSRTVRFAALPVGRYVVVVGRGQVLFRDEELARGEIDLVAGGPASLVLTLSDPPAAKPVAYAGVLAVPAGYAGRVGKAELRRLGDAPDGRHFVPIEIHEQPTAAARSLRFETSGAAPGPYSLVLRTLPALVEVEVPPEGDTAAVLVVPPPRRVHVSLHDSSTGTPVAGYVHWFPVDERLGDDGSNGWKLSGAGDAACTLDAPGCALRLLVFAPGYLDATIDVAASDEPAVDVPVALHARRGLRVRYADAGEEVRLPTLYTPMIRALPGGERVRLASDFWSSDVGPLELQLPPGRYTVEPVLPSRYERPETFEIEVPPVGFAEHTVQLVRRP